MNRFHISSVQMKMYQVAILLMCLLASGLAGILHQSQVIITANYHDPETYVTTNLTLKCQLNPTLAARFWEISTMRLIRVDGDEDFTVMAKVVSQNGFDSNWWIEEEELEVEGHIHKKSCRDLDAVKKMKAENPPDTMLKVTWELVSEFTDGLYYCDVAGYEKIKDKWEILWAMSNMVEISVKNPKVGLSAERMLLRKLARMRMSLARQMEDTRSTFRANLEILQKKMPHYETQLNRRAHTFANKLYAELDMIEASKEEQLDQLAENIRDLSEEEQDDEENETVEEE